MKKLFLLFVSLCWMTVVNAHITQAEIDAFTAEDQAGYNSTVLSSSQEADVMAMMESIFDDATGSGTPPTSASYQPDALKTDYYEIARDIYTGGNATKASYDYFVASYTSLNSYIASEPSDPDDKKTFWLNTYKTLWQNFLTHINNNPQTCAGEGVLSTTRKCCPGLVESTKSIAAGSTCGKTASSCTEDSNCCSGLCQKSDPNGPGTCTSPKQCYKPVPLGGACGGALTPLCQAGFCKTINSETYGGECKQIDATCSENSDCCSDKCSGNKCVQNKICKDCATNNQTPNSTQVCCEGLYLDTGSGKCKMDIHPMDYVLPPETGFIQKVINAIIPSAHAALSTEEAERESISRVASECAANHTAGSSEYSSCVRMAPQVVAVGANDRVGLTPEQKKEIDEDFKNCNTLHRPGSVARKECTDSIEKKEQELVDENIENGVDTGDTNAADLIKKYKAPSITEKTYSNPKECKFNSYNDNWRAASNIEKNAEVFLRSFEFVYSGNGTQDFWQDEDKGNIWSRASKVARKFRENRSKLIQTMKETDIKMTCQCIAIWGPANFDASQQEFFASSACTEERAKVMAAMGAGVDEHKDDDANKDADGKSDIGSLKSTEEEDEDKLNGAKMEEVDKGAAGISHEKLLVEWLGMRADAQMDRFTENSELEKELIELSTFISDKDFREVWNGELKNDGWVHDKGNPEGDNTLLYRFGTKYYRGWVKIVLVLTAISLVVAAVFVEAITGGLLAGTLTAATVSLLLAFHASNYGGKGSPGAYDLKIFKKKGYNWKYKWDGYERWWIGPRYDNKSTDPATRCDIFGKASSCLRSAYQVKLDNMKYLTDYEGREHFVIDTNSPHYSTKSRYSMETMPGLTLNWKDIINKMRNDGVDFLLKTNPCGSPGAECGKSRGGKKYAVKKKNYLKIDIMEMALKENHFLPLRGRFTAVPFDQKADLRKAAIKYAKCTFMKQPEVADATLDPTCFIGDDSVKKGDVGFGYLFESDAEAAEFADYTYEMHFLYSQISKSDYMGYPLLGQDAYFRAVAYNMKLVGSLASQRAQNYGETYALYQEDWEKRIGDYKGLGEGDIGSGSRNIKYSKQFYKAFGLLEFDPQVSRENFDAILANAKSSGKFSAAEMRALEAKHQSALRTSEQADKVNAYNEQRGTNKVSLKRNAAASQFMKKLNSPLAAFKMNKLGGGYGYDDVADALGSLNKNIAGLNTRLKRNKRSANGAFKGFNMPSGFSMPSSSRSARSGGSSLNTSSGGLASFMKESDAKKIINGLKSGSSLEPNSKDSLWTILSKAYKRNYSRVLLRSNRVETKKFDVIEKGKKKNILNKGDAEKAKLKQLLEAN